MSSRSPLRLYGRRKGRPLRAHKAELIKKLLPELKIALPEKEAPGAYPYTMDCDSLFPFKPHSLWLEIGFGGGEHLAAQAKNNPAIGFIGCEPFVNGIASLCSHIDKGDIRNIRIFPNDARVCLDALPDASIARCFILFPDPWPKARHAERRFIGPENLARLARVMRRSAELRLATDEAQLATWIRTCMQAAASFRPLYDAATPPEDWIETRYEQKALKAGRAPAYMSWQRV